MSRIGPDVVGICVQATRVVCVLAVIGLVVMLAPVAGARRVSSLRGWTFVASGRNAPRQLVRHPRARRDVAHSAIVGGEQVAIGKVPWQVAVLAEVRVENDGKNEVLYELCGGVILGESRVLTAAHCMFNPADGTQLATSDLVVVAGSSDLDKRESTEQDATVASFRVHPYFDYAAGPGTPDDVAVLTLSRSLNLTDSAAQAIGVVPASTSLLPEGDQTRMSGYGRETPEFGPSGELYSLDMTLGPNDACGGEANALFVCARTPSGSACSGDSGGGLTSTGGTPTLLGTLSTIEVEFEQECDDGADNGFVNLAAPEIHDFIDNEYSLPPKAPRGGNGAKMIGARYGVDGPSVGETITCEPGSWSGEPAFTYAFIDEATGQVLQSGASSTYQVTSADLGMRIFCRFLATNAGGTAFKQTEALQAVEPEEIEWGAIAAADVVAEYWAARHAAEATAKEHQAHEEAERKALIERQDAASMLASPLASNITVKRDGTALVELECTGSAAGQSCAGKLALSVQATRKSGQRSRTVTATIATAQFSVGAGKTATVHVDLNRVGRALLRTSHGRLGAHLTILQSTPASHTQIRSVWLIGQKSHDKTRQ
jgi:hypothetical protein